MSETPLQCLEKKRDSALKMADSTFNPVERSKWQSIAEAYATGVWAVQKTMEGDRDD